MRAMCTSAAVLAITLIGSAAMLGGCQGGPKGEDEAACANPKPGTIVTVNQYCAVNNADPVDPSLVREWKGQKIGFCCKGCLPQWDKMTDAEKDAAVARAVAKGPIKS